MSPWHTARRIAEGWTIVVLLALVMAWTFVRSANVPSWLPLLGIWGLIFPALGWRYYQYRRESASRRPYLNTIGAIFHWGGLTALFASGAFFLTGAPAVLTGVAGYLLLAGVLWPNELRYHVFEQRSDSEVSE